MKAAFGKDNAQLHQLPGRIVNNTSSKQLRCDAGLDIRPLAELRAGSEGNQGSSSVGQGLEHLDARSASIAGLPQQDGNSAHPLNR